MLVGETSGQKSCLPAEYNFFVTEFIISVVCKKLVSIIVLYKYIHTLQGLLKYVQ